MVSEITWRATKMRTKAGNFVVVPNSVLAKDTIINYCEPTRSLRLQVEVGASYDVPPNVVKTVIRQALRDAPGILHDRAPEVLLGEFAQLVDRLPRALLDQRLRSRRAREGSRPLADLLRVQAQQHHHSVSDSGGTVGRRGRHGAGPQDRRRRHAGGGCVVLAALRQRAGRADCGREARCNMPPAKRSSARARPADRCSSSFGARRR